jgi:carboxyl-terminal processing protease
MSLKNFKIPFSIIVLTLGIVLGYQIEKVFSGDNLRENIIKFNDVMTFTEKYYIEKVDTQKLIESAINGMLNDLDPHSVYIPAAQMESVEESFRGDFEGIGIEFQVVNDTLTVVSPISGGPSEQLGIRPGDRIVKIDGEDAIGITNEIVRKKLRGKAGSQVSVTILRPGVRDLIDYEITRAKIPLYSVDTHFMIDLNTGYVSVSRFSETTYDEVVTALSDLKDQGMKQLIFDLRGNPGGYLNQAVQIADLFVEGKKKIVYTEGRRTEFNDEFFASEPSPYENIPIVILINKGSASASEIVSGAVQDWDRGIIVGETSFGKGLVQRQFTLPDNSALRLTISEYFTPTGRSIQRNYKDKKDKNEYYSEVGEREEDEMNNMDHTAEHDTTRPIFKTNAGRSVYGGGGITPDYIIQSHDITEYTTNLLRNNLFYEFSLAYIGNNDVKIRNQFGTDLKQYVARFEPSEADLNNFNQFVTAKGVEFDEKDYETDKEFISARIKAQIARHYWKNQGWYSVLLTIDNQALKALTLFEEAKNLANLK